MDEIDVWRSARLLINQHGERAELAAAGRVDDMIAHGNPTGEATWKRILAAVRELLKGAPAGGEPLH